MWRGCSRTQAASRFTATSALSGTPAAASTTRTQSTVRPMQAFPLERRIVLMDYGRIALPADALRDHADVPCRYGTRTGLDSLHRDRHPPGDDRDRLAPRPRAAPLAPPFHRAPSRPPRSQV